MYANRIEALFTWLGGGEWQELGERHERSTHALAGAVVLLGAALAWLVSAGRRLVDGLADGGRHPADLGVRSAGRGRQPRDLQWSDAGRAGLAGRAAVGVAVGVVVGELAAVVLFSGSIDRLLDGRAAARGDSTPAVAQASAELDQAPGGAHRTRRRGGRALQLRDEALVVARCEYNPSPDCPQNHITGCPAPGPKPVRRTTFSRTRSDSWTPRRRTATACTRTRTPRSLQMNRRWTGPHRRQRRRSGSRPGLALGGDERAHLRESGAMYCAWRRSHSSRC